MTTPWTGYGYVVDSHRRELLASVPAPRRHRHRTTPRPGSDTSRRQPAARPATTA